jgi:hypothetical protein
VQVAPLLREAKTLACAYDTEQAAAAPEDRDLEQVWPLAHGRCLPVRGRPLVMGILNVTPDSFSDGGAHAEECARPASPTCQRASH